MAGGIDVIPRCTYAPVQPAAPPFAQGGVPEGLSVLFLLGPFPFLFLQHLRTVRCTIPNFQLVHSQAPLPLFADLPGWQWSNESGRLFPWVPLYRVF